MSTLIIGGAGYVGSHTVLALREEGVTTVVYDNLSTGHRDAVFSDHFVHGELSDKDKLRETIKAFDIDSVIHFAALIEAGQSVKEPLAFYRNNVANTIGLLEVMEETNVTNLVFSSTAAIYGDQIEDGLLNETLDMAPINPYGRTKAAVESLLRDVSAASSLKAIALRYFNASGADSEGRAGERHDPETHLIPLILKTAAGQRDYISIFGTDYDTPDGTCVRDYIHVSDLAKGHIAALKLLLSSNSDDGSYMAFNLGAGKGYSVKEVIDACKVITGKKFKVIEDKRRQGDPAILVADAALVKDQLNWMAERSSLDTIIQDAWNYMCRHG